MANRISSHIIPLLAFVAAPLAFCAGAALVWFGPVAHREGMLALMQADEARTATYQGFAPSNAPRFALVESFIADRAAPAPIVAREKASQCVYYGTVKPDSNNPPKNAIAVFEREVCPSPGTFASTREVTFFAPLGTIGEPPRVGSEISIYRTISIPGLGRMAPDMILKDAKAALGAIEQEAAKQ